MLPICHQKQTAGVRVQTECQVLMVAGMLPVSLCWHRRSLWDKNKFVCHWNQSNHFEASAAMILKGGLPIRSGFQVEVVSITMFGDGLAEGRCNFTFEAGTVCSPVTGNPFAALDPYRMCHQPMELRMYLYIPMHLQHFQCKWTGLWNRRVCFPTDPPVIRRLQPYMYAFELKKRGSSAVISGREIGLKIIGYTTLQPINVLQAETAHTIRELRPESGKRQGPDIRRSFYREERIHEFTTGAEPNKIVKWKTYHLLILYINQQTF